MAGAGSSAVLTLVCTCISCVPRGHAPQHTLLRTATCFLKTRGSLPGEQGRQEARIPQGAVLNPGGQVEMSWTLVSSHLPPEVGVTLGASEFHSRTELGLPTVAVALGLPFISSFCFPPPFPLPCGVSWDPCRHNSGACLLGGRPQIQTVNLKLSRTTLNHSFIGMCIYIST